MYTDKIAALSPGRVMVLSAGVGFLSILYAGIYSEPYLADEAFHYRLAGYIYDSRAIPHYDPLLHTNPLTGRNYYVNEPLWHCLLAAFWTLTGHSQLSGQIFQGLIYLGMVFSAYLLGKEMHSKECGYYTAILAASSPFVILYSILFHVDIFLMMLCTLCYVMLLRKRFVWAGIILGLALITKRNAYFIAPAAAFSVLYYSDGLLRDKAGKFLIFLLAVSVVAGPEVYRRHAEFGFYGTVRTAPAEPATVPAPGSEGTPAPELPIIIVEEDAVSPVQRRPLVGMPERPVTLIAGGWAEKIMKRIMMVMQPGDTIYEPAGGDETRRRFEHPESVLRPGVVVMYLGLPLVIILIITAVYIFRNRALIGLSDKRLVLVYAVVPSFLVFYAVCFFNNWGLRYTSPILVFAFLLGGYGLTVLKGRGWDYLRFILVFGCIIQIIATAFYIRKYREIPAGVRQAYEYAGKYIPPGHLTLSTRGAYALYTGRPMLWYSPCAPIELDRIFWKADEGEVREIFGKFGVRYLFIDKDRIYDDSKVRHVLGYPASFIKKLGGFRCMKLIFNNRNVAIWQIRYD